MLQNFFFLEQSDLWLEDVQIFQAPVGVFLHDWFLCRNRQRMTCKANEIDTTVSKMGFEMKVWYKYYYKYIY